MADPGTDTTVIAAFAVGFASFVSPCVLPLVPGYLSAVSGASIDDLKSGEKTRSVILPALIFCLAFTIVFVALGMTATGLGSALRENRETLNKIAGAMIIALGTFFLLTPFITKINREWHPEALMRKASSGGGPLIAGAAFAIAWTPCVSPTLGSILTAAATQNTVAKGGVLLAFYSAGLAIPFLLTAVAFNKATRVFRWLRDHYLIVNTISGAILLTMGILIFSGEITQLNSEMQKFMNDIGLDKLYSF